jgi:hypothetical protein
MDYICDVDMSDFPCKFFIKTEGKDTIIRMSRFKHIDTYLNDIDYNISIVPEFHSIAPAYKRRYKYNKFRFDDENDELENDNETVEYHPRRVMEETTLM